MPRLASMILAAGLILGAGCGGGNSPVDQANQALRAEAGKQLGNALGDALKSRMEEIKKQEVTIHALGIPPDQQKDVIEKITAQIKPLLPAGNQSIGYHPRWIEPEREYWDLHVLEFTAAPVTDVKAFARNLTFGAVRAVDEEGRQILLDYGKDTTAMDTWGGAKEIAAMLVETERETRSERLAQYGGSLMDHLAKQHGRETVAYLVFEGQREADPISAFHPRLKVVAERLKLPFATTGWHWNDTSASTAMVTGADLEAFARAVDFAKVKWLDPKRRLIVFTYTKPGTVAPPTPAQPATDPAPKAPADSHPK